MEEDFLKNLDHEEHEEHPDERWLVSYADMMTLLFGLFVMLYSIAMENQGKVDDVLKDVRLADKQVVKPAQPTPPPIDPEQFAQLQKQVEEQSRELELLREMKLQTEMNMQTLQNQVQEQQRTIASLPKEFIPDVREDLRQAQQKIEELQRTIASIPKPEPPRPQPRDYSEDFQRSQEQLKETKSELKDLRKQLQAALEKTKKALPEKKDNSQKLLAQIDEQQAQINQMKQQLEEKSRQLASTSTQAQQAQQQEEEMRRQQEELRKKDQEMKKLQAQIKELETKTEDKGGSFLMFVVKWSTDKHDIDMTVTDPKGRKYDFKKRKFGNSPGEFTLDSRQGPGAEIWQADNFEPGIYTVTANLYQAYGNDKPAKLEASVVSSLRSLRLPASQLTEGNKISWKIKIAQNGEVTVL